MALLDTNPVENGDAGESAAGSDFEMSLANISHAESPQESRQPQSAPVKALVPFTVSIRQPLTVFPELTSQFVVPPISATQAVSSTPDSNPSRATAEPPPTAEAPASSGKSAFKTTGKSGSGHGQTAKRGKFTNPPKLLQSPAPRYPAKAKASKITGMAAVLIEVRSTGTAKATALYRSSGNADLDQAAVAAARSWKFSCSPSLGADETIPVIVHVTFSL